MKPKQTLILIPIALFGLQLVALSEPGLIPVAASADSLGLESSRNTGLIRFEINNDMVWNHDSNFSNGWSLQYHSKVFEDWEHSEYPDLMQWVGEHVPGLSEEDSVVRVGHGIGQNMMTPGDLSLEVPQEGDLPYAGSFTYSMSWQNFNANSMRAFQVTVGIMGQESFAEQFQKFVHNDLGRGDDPKGWDTQRESEPIVNFGYEYGKRLWYCGAYENDWAGQISASGSFSLGNMFTATEVGLAFRGGWNIPEGFNAFPAPPGRGVFESSLLPKSENASKHGMEFVAGVRGSYIPYAVIYDGSFITDDGRGVDRNDSVVTGFFALNYHLYEHFSIRLSVQSSSDMMIADSLPQAAPGYETTEAAISFGSLTFDWNF